MSKKGLSAEQKRNKMLEIFWERKDIFLLKELEKIGSKEKGVVEQSIKDVVQSLCDDGLIDSDKVGVSTYYWSFPSQAGVKRKNQIQLLDAEAKRLKAGLAALSKELEMARSAQTDDPTVREKRAAELAAVEEENKKCTMELDALKDFDPDVLRRRIAVTNAAKDCANRWTDNTFILRKYCMDKFGKDQSDIDKLLGIPEDFDYMPEKIQDIVASAKPQKQQQKGSTAPAPPSKWTPASKMDKDSVAGGGSSKTSGPAKKKKKITHDDDDGGGADGDDDGEARCVEADDGADYPLPGQGEYPLGDDD